MPPAKAGAKFATGDMAGRILRLLACPEHPGSWYTLNSENFQKGRLHLMPETKNYTFSYTELAELLVKRMDVHEGFWGVYIEFNFAATNINAGPDPKSLAPAAIAAIKSVGIQRFDAPNNLTVDATIVNPLPPHGSSGER